MGLCALILCFVAGASAQDEEAAEEDAAIEVDDEAPDFTLKDLDGEEYTLAEILEESIVLLDFGRFTCLPCRDTAVMLQTLHEEYGDKGVRIFQVNLDGPVAERVLPNAKYEHGVTFPVLLDAEYEVAEAYRVEAIPFLVLIDQERIVRFVHPGYEEEVADELRGLFDEYRPKEPEEAGLDDDGGR